MAGNIDLATYAYHLELEDEEFTSGMGNAEKSTEGFKGKMGSLTDFLKTSVAVGIVGVGVALGAMAVGGVKMGDDLQKALNGIESATGYSDESMKGMKDTMLSIYNNNFGEDFTDIGKSIQEVGQITGETGKDLEGLTTNALMLRDTFEFDVTESTRSASMMMKQFGDTGTDAFNLIAQGAQWGLDKNGDLLDSINEYSTNFAMAGMSSQDMFNMFQNGMEGGVISSDKIGDAIKEFGIRSKDMSKTSSDAFKSLGLDANTTFAQFAKGGETGKKAFEDVTKKLFEMKDPLAQNTTGTSLFGSMWEDVGAKGIQALTDTRGEISKTTDALGKINAVKYNTFGEAMEGIKRNLTTGVLLPIGDQILPILSDFTNTVSKNMPEIKNEINFTMNSIGSAIKGTADVITTYIMPVFNTLSNWIKPNVSAMSTTFNSSFLGIKKIIEDVANSVKINVMPVLKALLDWIKPNVPVFRKVFEEAFNFISKIILPFFKTEIEVITKDVLPALSNLFMFIVKNVLPIFSEYWKWMADTIIPMLQKVFEKILPPIQEIIKNLGEIFKVYVEKIREYIDILVKVFNFAFPFIKGVVEGVITNIGNIVGGLVKTLSGVIEFITGVFTGNWSKAWDGVKNIFGGVFDSLVGLVKAPFNTITGMINGLLEHIAKIKISIPSVSIPGLGDIGGGSIGFENIGKMPYLAEGGITTKAMLSVIGDNPSGMEAVLPIEKLDGIIASAMNKANTNSKQTNGVGDINFNSPLISISGDVSENLLPKLKELANNVKDMVTSEIRREQNLRGQLAH